MMEVALALVGRTGRWFLQRRDPAGAVLPGLWEFPGGKLELGESPEAALRRELLEETGLVAVAFQPVTPVDGAVLLHPFLVEAAGDPATALAWGWFTPEEMARLPVPPANASLIRMLTELPREAPAPPSGS